MPRPIILQDQSGLAQGITGFGSALGGALEQRGQQAREAQGLSVYQKGLEAAQNDPESIARAYSDAISRGANPDQLQALSQSYQQARKSNAFSTALDEALDLGGINTSEGKNVFLKSYAREGGNPFEAMNYFKKDDKGENTFDKKINEFKANSVIDYLQSGDERTINLRKNLDYLEENIENVGRAKGILTGEWAYGGEKFTEFRNRGNLVLDGVIKVFNRAGVLPQKKLEWIRETFGISPMDTQAQIKGKINSLRTLAKEASTFDEGIGNLVNKYGENIPNSEFLKLQKNVDSSFRKFDQQIASSQQEKVFDKLPTSGVKKGTTAVDSDTGQKFIYSGTRWVKQK